VSDAELFGVVCAWDRVEAHAAAELAAALGESRVRAGDLLGCAWELAARLPGTAAALRGRVISWMPQTRRHLRLRAQHPVRGGWPVVFV
jgi:hypothetical protein